MMYKTFTEHILLFEGGFVSGTGNNRQVYAWSDIYSMQTLYQQAQGMVGIELHIIRNDLKKFVFRAGYEPIFRLPNSKLFNRYSRIQTVTYID